MGEPGKRMGSVGNCNVYLSRHWQISVCAQVYTYYMCFLVCVGVYTSVCIQNCLSTRCYLYGKILHFCLLNCISIYYIMCFCRKLFVQLSTVKNGALYELFIIIINITAWWSGTVEGNYETKRHSSGRRRQQRGFFFFLSFKQRWNKRKPPSNPSPPKAKQNRKYITWFLLRPVTQAVTAGRNTFYHNTSTATTGTWTWTSRT